MKYLKTDRKQKRANVLEVTPGGTVQHSTNPDFGLVAFADITDISNRLAELARDLPPEGLRDALINLEGKDATEVATVFGYTVEDQ